MNQPRKIDEAFLAEMRARRSSGEPVKKLAEEVGWTWQKLDKSLRNGLRSGDVPTIRIVKSGAPSIDWNVPAATVKLCVDPKAQRLVEKYRPNSVDSLCGQKTVMAKLGKFVKQPYPTSFVFYGDTGTGKTSAALTVARELGCDLSAKEIGGLFVVASGEQTADAVRDLWKGLMYCPLNKTGWRVVVVNEADRMHQQAETVWLDRLENLPKKTVVIFTTNHIDKMTARFRDRSEKVPFVASIPEILPAAKGLVKAIYEAETGKEPSEETVEKIVRGSAEGGAISMRRVVQTTAETLLTDA